MIATQAQSFVVLLIKQLASVEQEHAKRKEGKEIDCLWFSGCGNIFVNGNSWMDSRTPITHIEGDFENV
jgi:hypothetical protein